MARKKANWDRLREECLKRVKTEGFVPMILADELDLVETEEIGKSYLSYKGAPIWEMSQQEWVTIIHRLGEMALEARTDVVVYDEALGNCPGCEYDAHPEDGAPIYPKHVCGKEEN